MPAHSSKPPMCQPSRSRTDFQEFTYPSVLMAKRAIADYLSSHWPSCLPNNAHRLTRSSPLRSKKDVIAQVRGLYPSGDGRRDARRSDGALRAPPRLYGAVGVFRDRSCAAHAPGTQARDQTRQAGGPVRDRGCGKTTMLRRVQESIEQEKEILVSKALSVEKSQIHLGGLIVALFADLATSGSRSRPNPNGGNVPSAIW